MLPLCSSYVKAKLWRMTGPNCPTNHFVCFCCYFMMQQKFTCSWWWLQQEKKTGWGLTDSTLTSQHPSPPSVTRTPWGCSVVRAAYRQQYIMAPSCLKTIWKLLGYDPSGGWGLWVFGEHHVSQSQLYKLRAHAPQIQISSTQCIWACGSLGAESGSSWGAVEAWYSVAKSNVHSVVGQM